MTRALALLLCATGIGLVGFAVWSFLGEPVEIAPLGPEARPLEGRPPDAAPAPSAPLDSLPFTAPPLSRPGGTTYPNRSTGLEGLMVVDPEGRPIPGAVVALCDRWEAAGPRVRRRDRCDDRGILELDAERLHYPILFCTHAGATGWILHEELEPQRSGVGQPLRRTPTLALRRPTRVVVSVANESGEPLVRYPVVMDPEGPRVPAAVLHGEWSRSRSALTDARGIAEFAIDPGDALSGRAGQFRVGVPNRRSDWFGLAYDPEGDLRIDIVIPDGPMLLFRAVDGMGRPRDIELSIWFRGETEGKEHWAQELALEGGELLCPSDWSFDRVRVVPWYCIRRGLVVETRPSSQTAVLESAVLDGAVPVTFAPDAPHPRVVTVEVDELPPVISVPVLRPEGGPAAGREIGVCEGEGVVHEVALDDLGRFQVVGDRPRTLVLSPPHHSRCWFGATTIELPKTDRDLRFAPVRLEAPIFLAAGRVTEEDGRAVFGAMVSASWGGWTREVRSARDGYFEFLGERWPAREILLEVATGRPSRSLAQRVEAGICDLLLRLPALGDLEGSLGATPFPDMPFIRISLRHETRGLIETPWDEFRQPEGDGRFRIEAIPAGTVDLHIEAAGARSVSVSAVEITAGKTSRDPRLQKLELVDAASFRRVEVVSPGGMRIPRAIVIWSSPSSLAGNSLIEMETDAEGAALIAHHPGPPGLLVVEGPGEELSAVYAPDPPTRVTLHAAAPCTLHIPGPLAGAAVGGHGVISLQLTPQPRSCPPALLRGIPTRDLRLDGQPTLILSLSPGRYRATLVRRSGRFGRDTRSVDIEACTVDTETLRFGIPLAIDPAALADLLR